MRIGITTETVDSSEQLRGVPVRVTQLLRQFRHRHDHEFVLLRYDDEPSPLYEGFEEVRLRPVGGPSPVVSKAVGNSQRVPPAVRDLDVVHLTNPFLYELPLLSVDGPKSVVTIHDLAYYYPDSRAHLRDRPKAWAYQQLWKLGMRAAHLNVDRFVAVSENTRGELARYLDVTPDRTSVVYNGIDEAFRLVDVDREADPDVPVDPYLLTDKPFPDLFRIFARLKDRGLEHDLVVFSGRGYVDDDFIEDLGLTDDVTFLGYVPQERLVKLYNCAAAYLRLVYFDGFGIPSLEAMACGCPPFVADVNAAPEVVADAGVLIDPSDLDGWVDAVFDLLTDEARYAALRERGLERAGQFSWERTARETIGVYESVVR